MRIGLLSYGLDRHLGGISRYTLEIARALAEVPSAPEVLLLATGQIAGSVRDHRLQCIPLHGCSRLPGFVTLGNCVIPAAARRLRLDVVHDPSGVTPFLFGAASARTVVTVHDVFAWSCPGHSTLLDTWIYRHWLPRVLPMVDAVITDSQASRNDIVRYLKLPRGRVTVIQPGVGPEYRPVAPAEAAAVAHSYHLPQHYMLYVGSIEARKNLPRLLQACALLWQAGEPRPLVLAGTTKWNYTGILRMLEQAAIKERVILTGELPDADLPAIYSGADLFVFPSLYEGFGFPPLEAMACGTPVVCSNAASLPEVVGDAAVMVSPNDVAGLAEAMQRVLADKALREELRARGLVRASKFTWERAAQETLAVYRQVL